MHPIVCCTILYDHRTQQPYIKYQYSYMLRPPDVIIRLALEHFKREYINFITVNEISFRTQYVHNCCLSF